MSEYKKSSVAKKVSTTLNERDLLCCPICLTIFDHPKSLTCGHTLCQPCISEVSYKNGAILSCPECRQQSIVPEQGLPTNYVLQRLVDEVKHDEMKEKVAKEAKNFHERATDVSEKLTKMYEEKSPDMDLTNTINSLLPAALCLEKQAETKDKDWCVQVVENLQKLSDVLESIVAKIDGACIALNDELHTALKILNLNCPEELFLHAIPVTQTKDEPKLGERRRKPKFEAGVSVEEYMVPAQPTQALESLESEKVVEDVLDVIVDQPPPLELIPSPIPQCIMIIGGGQTDLKSFEYYFPDQPSDNTIIPHGPQVGRFGAVCGSTVDKVLISGGVNMKSTDIFDLVTQRWSTGPDMSTNRFAAASAMFQQELFVFGGTGLSSSEVLKPDYTYWSGIASIPHEVAYGACVAIGNQIYLLGGCNEASDYFPLSSAIAYIPSRDQWTVCPPLEFPRKSLAAVATGQTMVVCGGEDEHRSTVNTCQRFDPRSGIWMDVAPMNEHRRAHCLLYYKDRIIAIGGTSSGRLLDTVEQYDPNNDTWFYVEPLKMQRDYFAAVCV